MSEHTKTPWRLGTEWTPWDGAIGILPSDQDEESAIAWTTSGSNEADNAAFIIKAVNNHDNLVKALQSLVDSVNDYGMELDAAARAKAVLALVPPQAAGGVMLDWKPIDDKARDGREVLLRHGADGNIYMGYYGLANRAYGAGASTNYPWTILDNTNGVNHIRDGGEFGVTHYADITALAAPSQRGEG